MNIINMMIIGLVGFKQSGKSTAAKYLEEKYGFVRHNFKDALIAELKQNFPDLLNAIANTTQEYIKPEDRVDITDLLFEMKPPLIRTLMQNYGTDVRRKDNPHYWTTAWMMGVAKHFEEEEYNIVVDDVRFMNEANTIRSFGSLLSVPYEQKIIRIMREDITTGGDHQSETEQLAIEADHTIQTAPGDFQGLYKALDDIMQKWKHLPKNQRCT